MTCHGALLLYIQQIKNLKKYRHKKRYIPPIQHNLNNENSQNNTTVMQNNFLNQNRG